MDEFEEALAEACNGAWNVAVIREDATAMRVIRVLRDPASRTSMERLAQSVLEAVVPNV